MHEICISKLFSYRFAFHKVSQMSVYIRTIPFATSSDVKTTIIIRTDIKTTIRNIKVIFYFRISEKKN